MVALLVCLIVLFDLIVQLLVLIVQLLAAGEATCNMPDVYNSALRTPSIGSLGSLGY